MRKNGGIRSDWSLPGVRRDFLKNRAVYLMALPVVAYFLIFQYGPMFGVAIAFQDYLPQAGIAGSPWVGIKHFRDFLGSYYFIRLIKNTLLISLSSVVWGFPAPIILALLLNEVRHRAFKRTVQTITYLPHFISLVVVCGLLTDFTGTYGLLNDMVALFGGERSNLLGRPELFRTIYVASGIWQEVGWGSIVYLGALAAIDPELYNAATIDGAGRWGQMVHITLPGLLPTVIVLLILRLGNIMGVGFEKIILLYNPLTYGTADVISSFTYRKGLEDFNFSYSSAVGLFNSVINLSLLMAANWVSKRFTDYSLW